MLSVYSCKFTKAYRYREQAKRIPFRRLLEVYIRTLLSLHFLLIITIIQLSNIPRIQANPTSPTPTLSRLKSSSSSFKTIKMQFTSILSIVALAMTVSANPVPNPNNQPPANSCSSSQTLSCCGKQFGILGVQCATIGGRSSNWTFSNNRVFY